MGNPEKARRDLLDRELNLARVDLDALVPKWARRPTVRTLVLKELLAALEAEIHEGLIPPYGTIFVPPDSKVERLLPLGESELSLARKAADGSSALLAFREGEFAGLLLIDPSDAPDLQLARMARSLDGLVIRQTRTGVVRAYGPAGSVRQVGRRWTTSPAIDDAINRARKAAPMVPTSTLTSLLDFAFYVLSPWAVGATLIWLLSERTSDEINVDLRPFRLSVEPALEDVPVSFAAHLLAQFDGATVISREGQFLTTGIHLMASERAQTLIPRFRGTRHTSARRASYDQPDTLIVTVSADGPVTIFSDGAGIFDLWWFSADGLARVLRRAHGKSVDNAYVDVIRRDHMRKVWEDIGD